MAGAGYKLFNTGDVLTAAQVNTYLMEQTVMVFADAAARTAALSGVVSEGMISYLKDTNAVEVYNGSAWVASDDPNAIQNTIVDAKGDLITATAADTPARLAVGNNGETLVADSLASTGLRWQEPKAGNPIINSAFQVWQRGTSFTVGAAFPYTADRWQVIRGGVVAGMTFARATTSDTTNLPNIQYCARMQRDSGNTSTQYLEMAQSLETVDSIPFAGKTVTLSFYARKGANFSATSDILNYRLSTGTGTDQNLVTAGYTNQTQAIDANATLTTTWQRFQTSATLATTTTEIGLRFRYTPTGTAGAADYVEITGVQLEVGSVATPFKTYAATLAGELVACQRYYFRFGAKSGQTVAAFAPCGNGFILGSTDARINLQHPVTMRTTPTAVDFSSLTVNDSNNGSYAVSALAIDTAVAGMDCTRLIATISGATAYRYAYFTNNNSTSGYVGLSAEL